MTHHHLSKRLSLSAIHVFLTGLVLASGALFSPWAQAQNTASTPPNISGTPDGAALFDLGDAFVAPVKVDKQQTRLIFYRSSTSSFKGAASVYFNGMYHASLARNAFSTLCASPGVVNLAVKPVMAGRQVKEGFDSISALELQGGRNQYVRVTEDKNLKVLQPVSEQEALAELGTAREQIHTLSRVTPVQVCRNAPAQAAPIAPVQTLTLGADALFEFAGSDRKALGAQGRVALNNLIVNVKSNYNHVERIHVIGHADPIGSAQLNDRLSTERAQTVRDYLLEHGLSSIRITSEGRGASEPVVTTCARTARPKDIVCNSPNRRVTVEINGARR